MGKSIETYILLSSKNWHNALFDALSSRPNEIWVRIKEKEDFIAEKLILINPTKIFIPHWSYIIPSNVYEKWECIVFHMTDLPFGRGGSPLQNLIVRGIETTKISSIKVSKGIDTGDIYLKKELSLSGTAKQIFERASPIIGEMIDEIISKKITPVPQQGEPINFQRRKPEESNLETLEELKLVFDYIRMLDCEGYPSAFLETKNFKFDFSDAQFSTEQNCINANVRITKK